MKLPIPNIININRPAHTLLFITEAKTFRADTDRQGVLTSGVETIEAECPSLNRLADSLEHIAESATAPLGRKLWIFTPYLQVSALSVPSMQVEGVDEETLVQALQFELEGMTGQSSIDMVLAYHLLSVRDEFNNYWVSQVHQLVFEDIVLAAKKAGCRLGGIFHPGALPVPLHSSVTSEWIRLECWPGQILALSKQNEEDFNIRSFYLDSNHWQTELEEWFSEQDQAIHSESLYNNQIEFIPATDHSLYLNDNEAIAIWLGHWANLLLQNKVPPVPVLSPRSKINKELLLVSASGVGALVICGTHLLWNLYYTNHYTSEYESLQQTAKGIKALQAEIKKKREQRNTIKKQLTRLESDSKSIPDMLAALQKRPSGLLRAIATGHPDQMVLEEIEIDVDKVIVRGVTLESVAANEMTGYLEENLTGMGWSFDPPKKKDMNLFSESGGPWEYEIVLNDMGINGFKPVADNGINTAKR